MWDKILIKLGIIPILKERFMNNYSKQREIILEVIKNNRTHPTAEEIYILVTKKEPTISRSTVYRKIDNSWLLIYRRWAKGYSWKIIERWNKDEYLTASRGKRFQGRNSETRWICAPEDRGRYKERNKVNVNGKRNIIPERTR